MSPSCFCARTGVVAFFGLFALHFGLLAQAQETEQETVDLRELTCKQVMALSGVDRDTTIAFIHGYIAAKQAKDVIDLGALTDATEKFTDTCLDNPTSKAIATMEPLTKNSK